VPHINFVLYVHFSCIFVFDEGQLKLSLRAGGGLLTVNGKKT